MKKELLLAGLIASHPASLLIVNSTKAEAQARIDWETQMVLKGKQMVSTEAITQLVSFWYQGQWVSQVEKEVTWYIQLNEFPADESPTFYNLNGDPNDDFQMEYEVVIFQRFEHDGKILTVPVSRDYDRHFYANKYGKNLQIYDCNSTQSCYAGEFTRATIEALNPAQGEFLLRVDNNQEGIFADLQQDVIFKESKPGT